MLVQADEGKSR